MPTQQSMLEEQAPVRLTELQVEDFKKITFIRMAIKPGVTEISGHNGAGKTSALDAVAVWLDGLRVSDDKEPIRKGAQRARIRGRLGDMYVIRTISAKKGGGHETEIRFEPAVDNPKGKAYPATQAMLSDLIGQHQLDPLDFIKLDSKGKFDAMRAFVPGFNFDKAAREDAADFSRRTDVNRLAKESSAAASLIMVPKGTPEEPLDEQSLVQELGQASTKNVDIANARRAREDALEAIRTARETAGLVESQIAVATEDSRGIANRDIGRLEDQIRALQAQVATVREECEAEIQRQSQRLRQEAENNLTMADELETKLMNAEAIPEPVDVAALSQRIQDARRTNEHVRAGRTRAGHIATAERYEAEAETLTAQLAARRVAKQKAIADAKLPIGGIEFGDGEIRYNGVPFDQASTAQKLQVAIARIVALNPKLRLAWIRDASLLDDDSFAELARLSQEYSCDILIETVRPIGKDAIVLVDGHVKEAADEKAGAA